MEATQPATSVILTKCVNVDITFAPKRTCFASLEVRTGSVPFRERTVPTVDIHTGTAIVITVKSRSKEAVRYMSPYKK